MKKILFLALLAIATIANAQDIIVTRDARKIDAKVLEISKTEIKYKAIDNLDGPTYVLSVADLVTIIYANGKVELFINDQITQGDGEAERKAKEARAIAMANAQGSLFGNSGNGQGDGQKGNPVGKPQYSGNSWSLNDRNIIGTLPPPSNDFKQEGTVQIQIRVNANGNVVSAEHIGGTISDKATILSAINAAKRARFSKAEKETIGTITYNFKFN